MEHKSNKANQVCTGVLNVLSGEHGKQNRKARDANVKMRFLLDVAFESVYLAAFKEKSKRIVLSLFEFDVWGIHEEWQLKSIVDAHMKWGHLVEEVWLVYDQHTCIHPELDSLLKEKQIEFHTRHSVEDALNAKE